MPEPRKQLRHGAAPILDVEVTQEIESLFDDPFDDPDEGTLTPLDFEALEAELILRSDRRRR
jgi:hypothetical protein